MKFLHMADVHIGGWRDPKMSKLSVDAFAKTTDEAIKQQVDFVLIGGDLFNTALPSIDYIKETTKHLMKLKTSQIPVYLIPGSHDYSPSGKTMLDVLEYAGLVTNVVKANPSEDNKLHLKFTLDQKTGAKITGLLGKKLMLEKSYYEALERTSLEQEPGFKIFMFHTALDELKPKDFAKMESSPISLLPKGFDYYAGGHVHIVKHTSLPDYKNIVYPGPLFPNSFSELEKLKTGGYYMYDNGTTTFHPLTTKEVFLLTKDVTNKTPEEVMYWFDEEIKFRDIKDKIVLIRLQGKLKLGKVSDIGFSSWSSKVNEMGAYFFMKSTTQVESPEFEEIKTTLSPDEVEEQLIKEHLGQIKIEDMTNEQEHSLITNLIHSLSKEKQEGETIATFEERLLKDIEEIM